MPKVITRQYVELEGVQFEIGKEHIVPSQLLLENSYPQSISEHRWPQEVDYAWRLRSMDVGSMIQDMLRHGQSHPIEFTVDPDGELHLWDGMVRLVACHALIKPVKVIFTQR